LKPDFNKADGSHGIKLLICIIVFIDYCYYNLLRKRQYSLILLAGELQNIRMNGFQQLNLYLSNTKILIFTLNFHTFK